MSSAIQQADIHERADLLRNADFLGQFDGILARSPLGDTEYLTDQMHICFRRRLGKIASALPAAGELSAALDRADSFGRYRVLGDMVIRCAVQQSLRSIETGAPYGMPLDLCAEVFAAAAVQLADGTAGPLGSRLVDRLGPEPHQGWIWTDQRLDDVFFRAFRHLVGGHYSGLPTGIDPARTAVLITANRLLGDLVPELSRSALRHTHLVALFPSEGEWAGRISSSEYRLSGTVFLNRELLSDHWSTAEHLFHEALHQQLYDFRQAHSLLELDVEATSGGTICSLWNMPGSAGDNLWDVFRTIAAYHVYVQVALLSMLADVRADELAPIYGRQDAVRRMMAPSRALVRAQYLREQLRASFWPELGIGGRRLVDWLSPVLDILDPAPPPPGAYVHLILDRYRREARQILHTLHAAEDPTDLLETLRGLTAAEAEGTRRALGALGADAELERFNDAVASTLGEVPAEKEFATIRGIIATTIARMAPDGYRLAENMVPDAIVRQMVDESSDALVPLFEQ